MYELNKRIFIYFFPESSASKYIIWSEFRNFCEVVTALLSPCALAEASPISFIISDIFELVSLSKTKSLIN